MIGGHGGCILPENVVGKENPGKGELKEFYLDNRFSFLWHTGKKQGPFGNFRNTNRQTRVYAPYYPYFYE